MASPSIPAYTAKPPPSEHGTGVDLSILQRALPQDAMQLLRENTTIPELPVLCAFHLRTAYRYGIIDADAVFFKCVNEFSRLEIADDYTAASIRALILNILDLVDSLPFNATKLPLPIDRNKFSRNDIDGLICGWVILTNLIWTLPTRTCQDLTLIWAARTRSDQLTVICSLIRNEQRLDYRLKRRTPTSLDAGDQRKGHSDESVDDSDEILKNLEAQIQEETLRFTELQSRKRERIEELQADLASKRAANDRLEKALTK